MGDESIVWPTAPTIDLDLHRRRQTSRRTVTCWAVRLMVAITPHRGWFALWEAGGTQPSTWATAPGL